MILEFTVIILSLYSEKIILKELLTYISALLFVELLVLLQQFQSVVYQLEQI